MIDETNHELLSAYLDGELAADGRRRVEQLLAESAECRQAYEELCALRASLASLPRHRLDDDLGPRVIRIAEQSMPGKSRTSGAAAARREEGESVESSAGEVARAVEVSAADRSSRAWRAIIYPLLAVAAAVAMILNSPNEKHKRERQIAQAPLKQAPPAALSAPPGEAGAREASALDEGDRRRDAGAPEAAFYAPSRRMAANKAAGDQGTRLAEDEKNAPSGGTGYLAKPRGATIQSAPPALVARENDRKAGSESPQPTLVITCKLAPLAVQDKAFDTLLARNHLVPSSAPEIVAKKDSSQAEEPSVLASAKPSSFEFELPKKDADLPDETLAGVSLARQNNAWSESVVVELDAGQLVAVLADLQNHPDQFLSVELPAQSAGERQRVTALGVASDAVRSAGDSTSAEPAAESVPAQETDARASDPARRRADRGSPERLLVLFRLSAAHGN